MKVVSAKSDLGLVHPNFLRQELVRPAGMAISADRQNSLLGRSDASISAPRQTAIRTIRPFSGSYRSCRGAIIVGKDGNIDTKTPLGRFGTPHRRRYGPYVGTRMYSVSSSN